MNYFEITRYVDDMLGARIKSQSPITYRLLQDYTKRLVLLKNAGRTVELSSTLFCDFGGYRSINNFRFVYKYLKYLNFRRTSDDIKRVGEKPKILMSYNLNRRFPFLSKRVAEDAHVYQFVTALNIDLAEKTPAHNSIRLDHLFYKRGIGKNLSKLCEDLRECVKQDKIFNIVSLEDTVDKTERALEDLVESLVALLKDLKIEQFVSAFSDRYDEVLICEACRRLGIPSKEISHGINAHRLEKSDNIVPNNAQYFYVWSEQYFRGLSGFGEIERARVCGYPKYSQQQIEKLKATYRTKKQVTYFSQANYDVGSTTSYRLTPHYIQREKEFRKRVFEELLRIKKELGYKILVRYHQGEVASNNCDRTNEKEVIQEMGFEVSRNLFDKDFFESEYCIGINTSCLYEAYVMGKKVFQLKFPDCGEAQYETVDIVPVEKLKEVISEDQIKCRLSPEKIRTELLFDYEGVLGL